MTENFFPVAPHPTPLVLSTPFKLPPPINESLFFRACDRWRESSKGWSDLVAASPGLRDTLDQLLEQKLDLDGQQAGLLFTATDQQPQRFVSFTDACAFVLQHPTLETRLDQRCRVSGLKQGHALSNLTPLQMLERLKALDAQQAHGERWQAFWTARAPGTALSRQRHAIQLYRNHFEAAAEVAFAQNKLTADQLKPLQLIIDPPGTALTLDGQPIHTEQLALVLSNNSRIKLNGAWVITKGEAASSNQLLYLPGRPVAIQLFEARSDLQDWLSRQNLVPRGLPTENLRFEYTEQTDPMVVGASDLLAARQQAQITTLRNGTHGKSSLMEHGEQSLVQADRFDQQRSNTSVFAAPPRLEPTQSSDEVDEQPPFGSLYADIPWPLRQALVKQQREALESLIQEVGDGTGLQPFKDALKALEAAEDAADNAASALLGRSRTRDLVTFQSEFTALHDAHKAGLHAEAALQMALKQLSADEYSLLKALLDTPDTAGPEAVAASLTLSLTQQEGDKTTVNSEELKGVFVITHTDTLADADSPGSLLLYWAGSGGGLQRFANRRELERQMFKADAQSGMKLRLATISGDALRYSLDQLTSDFEEQAAAIRQRLSEPTDAQQRAEELEALRTRALATLQVPVHAARSLAFAHLLEQDRSATLASRLPDWLKTITEANRNAFKGLIEAYITAMNRSHELMTVLLEPRTDFTRKHLQVRLRTDFSITGHFDIQVNLPNSVTWETQHASGPYAPVPKTVMVPSAARSTMSLEDLAQLNIDNVQSTQQNALSQRLVFMNLQITASDDRDRVRLHNGINLTYLRKILPELNLPEAYEQLILDAFKGSATEPLFVREYRRECLIEPWRLMLRLQGECARLQQHISDEELKILNIAIDANTAARWRSDNKRIALWPASLSVGGKDTPGQGPATLSGVTFIEEQVGGVTLLYLPDSPDGRFLRRYDNLETARKALFNLCQQDWMIRYLAGRALHGDPRAHESRINAAVQKNFDTLIETGTAWPATTSLAAHLLDAHMGRLIATHRDTSRSNATLYLERYALEGPRAFNYIKMALGMMPFIGTAIALYDAWTAANQAAAAFLRGDVADGVEELKTVLLCLIDAAMDLVPGEAAVSGPSRAARALTRTRQLRGLASGAAALQIPSLRQARHVAARFAGYDYEQPISLSGLQPAPHGIYRNVYRHADGDFIVRQGRIFKVELGKDSRQWRLSGNSRKTYKQPIALDESGHWDTHFGVYGTTFEGGGLGGGNVQGMLLDVLDPLWPQAIRERLPRWWTDQALRRHHALTEACDQIGLRTQSQKQRTDTILARYDNTAASQRAKSLILEADLSCTADIALARQHYQKLVELFPLTQGNKRRKNLDIQSKAASLLTLRYGQRINLAHHRALPLLERIDALTADLGALPREAVSEHLKLLGDKRKIRLQLIQELDAINSLMGEMNYWHQRITLSAYKAELTPHVAPLNKRFSDLKIAHLKTGQLLEVVTRYELETDVSWFYLQSQVGPIRRQADQSLLIHLSLPEVNATRPQRNQILQECIDNYTRLIREMRVWTIRYPQHFHLDAVELLLTGLERMIVQARKDIHELPSAPVRTAGTSNKRVFTTENDQLLIGVERWETTTQRRQYIMTGSGGREEVWEQASNGKFRLLNPQTSTSLAPGMSLAALVAGAQKRLDEQPAYLTKVRSYAEQDMLPVDLEHMMVTEADDLSRRADDIQALAAQDAIIARLRDKATELKTIGRQLRTRQSLISKKPTDGMLDDLVRQNAVDIRKKAPLKHLGKRKDGRTDYMQEYEVWDLTSTPQKVLWYAHFHYSKAAPGLNEFEKAHLKLPEHRYQTHADNPDLPFADIGKRSAVLPHFENL
ncbi:hypothetical protein HNO86_01150 [Pseudomonas sp. C1C7]|uniref:dermonecrotic toxin domain-containing protein n=1 Tax=Pseudomonas sp. C1C7 TaxID=2735272 RepID=UPI0015862B94|nr:DUF6543 domain-containing protein [Pseudomonas sp. C1C7]NUT73641.1 hypothetical protein [Pseudomonas sp. C1C7]